MPANCLAARRRVDSGRSKSKSQTSGSSCIRAATKSAASSAVRGLKELISVRMRNCCSASSSSKSSWRQVAGDRRPQRRGLPSAAPRTRKFRSPSCRTQPAHRCRSARRRHGSRSSSSSTAAAVSSSRQHGCRACRMGTRCCRHFGLGKHQVPKRRRSVHLLAASAAKGEGDGWRGTCSSSTGAKLAFALPWRRTG